MTETFSFGTFVFLKIPEDGQIKKISDPENKGRK
jgi:hypothetical protein